jgi:hypothetical protein
MLNGELESLFIFLARKNSFLTGVSRDAALLGFTLWAS